MQKSPLYLGNPIMGQWHDTDVLKSSEEHKQQFSDLFSERFDFSD